MSLTNYLCFSLCVTMVAASSLNWLNKDISSQTDWTRPMCTIRKFLLTGKQRAFCRRHVHLMPYVSDSSTLAKNQCQDSFLYSQWDCMSILQAPDFGDDYLSNETAEAGYVHAISAASFAYTIASKCASNVIPNCACDNAIISGKIMFMQKKCPSLISNGVKLAQAFIAPGEKKIQKVKAKSAKKALLLELEKHNRNVGFKVLSELNTKKKCICLGKTGSCQVKTCYQTLPSFKLIGKELKKRFQEASLVYPDVQAGAFIPSEDRNDVVSDEELIYTVKSLKKCERAKNKKCVLKPGAENNCNTFCCNGQYRQTKIIVEAQCDCKFEYCCAVKCKTCYSTAMRNVCI